MERLLIGVDESLKLGVSPELLSSVGSELAPADNQRFEQAKHCIELMHLLFRQPQITQPQEPPFLDAQAKLAARGASVSSTPHATPPNSAKPFQNSPRYQVLRVLGAGAMGVVYEVFDQQRKASVALKQLRQIEPSRILRFKQEFRRLSKVSHENVVALFELAQADDDWFITMEIVNGTDFLSALTHRNIPTLLSDSEGAAPQALRQLCALFTQLAAGLNALHTAGILHRDLKPNNVLVTPEDHVVVIDFGLATSFDWLQLRGALLHEFAGTYAYMAPEQVACQSLTPASDWYSFGVMFYQALTGTLPVAGPLSLLTKQYLQPPGLLEHLPALPPLWNELSQRLLSRDPGDRPSGPEVAERLHDLQNALDKSQIHTSIKWRPTPGSTQEFKAFVGREIELDHLRLAFQAVLNGQPTVVSIQGLSGIGKTTLVESFLSEVADELQPVILRGRCHERESLPFKTLDSLVDSLCRHLSHCTAEQLRDWLPKDLPLLCRVFPVLGSLTTTRPTNPAVPGPESIPASTTAPDSDPVLLRRRAFDALRELLFALAEKSPVVIFIDDLQWGDVPGANVLADLLASARRAKLLLILAFRDEQTSGNACLNSLQLHRLPTLHNLSGVGDEPKVTGHFAKCNIALGPLSPADSARLATDLLVAYQTIPDDYDQRIGQPLERSASEPLQELIAAESGGMPFYVQELVRHAIGSQPTDHKTTAEVGGEKVSLSSVLRDRIDSLPDNARELVSMVAVAGQPVPLELVCDAIGVRTVDERQIHQLCVNRWLRSDRDTLQHKVTVFHDRIGESIVSALPQAQRQLMHTNLALSLEKSASTPPETLAYHFDAGNQPQLAGQYLQLAGKNAQKVFAFEKAIEHYRRALELSPSPEVAYELMRSLGEACSQAGRGGEAAEALLSAAAVAPPADALELRLAAARQYCISGYTDEGRLLVRAVLASNGMYFPKQFLVLVGSLIYQRFRLGLQGLKISLRQEAQGSRYELQRIDVMWSAVSGLSFQEPVAVAALHTQGLRAALAAGEPKRLARALSLESILSATPGPKTNDRVQKLLGLATEFAASSSDSDTLGMLHLAKGGTAFLQVRMPDALPSLIEAERLFSSSIPKAWWELTTARSLLAWAYMHIGDFCSLKRCIDLYQLDAQERGDLFLLSSISSAGMPQLQLAANQPDLAQAGLNRLEEIVPYKQFQQRHVSMLYSQAQIDLYRGEGLASWRRIVENWSLFRNSMQLQNQFARVSLIDLRSRCAVLEFKLSGDRYFLRYALGDLKRLKREIGTWVQPFIHRLQAVIFEAQSRFQESEVSLSKASENFYRIGFRACAAAAERRRGQLMNNTAGQRLVEQGEAYLRAQGIVDVDAFQRVLC
ncbi:MAG: protein kinase [Pirellulaceae bacterium]|nr:protein kinase [Pirellulaceae bacterium]